MGPDQMCEQELCAGGWKKTKGKRRNVFSIRSIWCCIPLEISLGRSTPRVFRVPAPKGRRRSTPPKHTSIAKSTISQETFYASH